ncbi:MAG: putative C-S lyase [Spirochaetaceae bacterium]|nr:MAG: putative C-S lyase [Spirochaetaceae bacterium]
METVTTRRKYDFDTLIDRKRTNSVKWDFCTCCDGAEDMLPMWVADMDFQAPPEVMEAVLRAAGHGVYGYSEMTDGYYEAIVNWVAARHRWELEPRWLSYSPGVITGMNVAIQTFTAPGDRIIVQSPVYPPFFASVINNGRQVSNNQLVLCDGEYRMDFEQLERVIDDRTRLLLLCSPHNPVGRVWRRDELERLADIALRHDLLVFSDEIHGDLVYQGYQHVPFASLGPEVAERTITGIAPSKTFNIAGLKASVIITPNARLRTAFDQAQERVFGLYTANVFAIAAAEAAYRDGGAWLDQALDYLGNNIDYTYRRLREHIPQVSATQPQGTFLMWLDFSRLGMTQQELRETIFCGARVGLNDGLSFGPGGDQHMRLNIGCPRSMVAEGLSRIAAVL